jgi:thiamine biosynthesis lipoprotein
MTATTAITPSCTATRIQMGMPITIEVVGPEANDGDIDDAFRFLREVERQFSTYLPDSEMTRLNHGLVTYDTASEAMRDMLDRADDTRRETGGHFNAWRDGRCDLAGVVKGWAIKAVADRLASRGYRDYLVNAGGDIQTAGGNVDGEAWRIGIRNPADVSQVVRVVWLSGEGIATSGTYERGDHIYRPMPVAPDDDPLVAITIIGPNVYDADRFATAAFAMGCLGISFVQSLDGYEGYAIHASGIARYTAGFRRYLVPRAAHTLPPEIEAVLDTTPGGNA